MNPIEQTLLTRNGMAETVRAYEINRKIRRKYSLSEELAILRQRDKRPEEFAAYDEYVEECKTEVDEQMGKEERA